MTPFFATNSNCSCFVLPSLRFLVAPHRWTLQMLTDYEHDSFAPLHGSSSIQDHENQAHGPENYLLALQDHLPATVLWFQLIALTTTRSSRIPYSAAHHISSTTFLFDARR
jgi:hypothetical protein